MKRFIGFLTLLLLAACAKGPVPAEPNLTTQAIITVNTFSDEADLIPNGLCSLREAIISANNNANFGGCIGVGPYNTTLPDTINLPAGNFVLTRASFPFASDQDWGDLDVQSAITINGPTTGVTTIQAIFTGFNSRVMEVKRRSTSDPPPTLILNRVVIRGGNSASSSVGTEGDGGGLAIQLGATATLNRVTLRDNITQGRGGGIFNCGTLTINNSTLRNNVATSNGGGIAQSCGTNLTVNQSVIYSNTTSARGGGLYQGTGGNTTTMTNTTISGNTATDRAGGIRTDGGTINLRNVTITRNVGTNTQGGIANANSTFNLRNTIVAQNTVTANPASSPDCAGVFVSQGNNLIGASNTCTGFGAATSDLTGTTTTLRNPLLAPLANNGGPTLTHAFLANSPAIDAGSTVAGTCPITDQRNQARPRDGNADGIVRCDIGAFETTTANLSMVLTDAVDPVSVGNPISFTMTIRNLGTITANNVTTLSILPKGIVSANTTTTGCIANPPSEGVPVWFVTCNLGNLASGSSRTRTFTATPGTTGTFTIPASVGSDTFDSVSSNNRDTEVTTVQP